MKDLGMMNYFLGLDVWHKTDEIFLSQGKYIVDILKKFWMLNCNPMAMPIVMNLKKISVSYSNSKENDLTLYIQLIGSLMYLVNTIPDTCYVVSTVSQFMS
jgi:hypothetical protein